MFRKEFAGEDLEEVSRYNWDQARYDPTSETFSDFLNNLNKTAKQAFGPEADKVIKMFLFGKLPVKTQQELIMANKEESSPAEVKFTLCVSIGTNRLQHHPQTSSHLTWLLRQPHQTNRRLQ